MSKSELAQAEKAATPPTPARAEEMFLDFLRENDASPPACPVCGYSLKALTRAICPECGQQLVLTVGATRLRFGWLFAAVAPGFFSGIAAFFVLVPIFGQLLFGNGRWEPLIVALDLFGWCSVFFAIFIATRTRRFIAQPRARQRWWTITIWGVHVAALGLFILFAFLDR